MLILLRHGATSLNDQHKVRGQLDIPMTAAGQQAVAKTATHFAGLPIDKIHSSPLQRSTGSAQILSKAIASQDGRPPQIVTNHALKPWNMGSLQGQSVGAKRAEINQFYMNPDKPTPGGGESYRQFLNRFIPAVQPLIEDEKPHLMVSHNRNMHAIEALAAGKGKGVDIETLLRHAEGRTPPGHVMVVDKSWQPKVMSPDD